MHTIKEESMALYKRVVAVTDHSVYTLEVHNWSTEMNSADRVTGELDGIFDVIRFDAPVVGETWKLDLVGGEFLETGIVRGSRVEDYDPHCQTWCGPDELDKFSHQSQSIYG